MEQKATNDRIYFGGLNGLRFFAATAVIFHHVEQYKLWAQRDGASYSSVFGGNSVLSIFFEALGHKAVSLFFVLSGFLITYLLLAEVRKTNTVSLKKFYMRRILRIWPVYYAVILLAFTIVPRFFDIGHYGQDMLANNVWIWFGLCFMMLPNLVRYNSVELVGGNQTWSVGVEEQFYILWPWLVRSFHKNLVRMLIMLIIVKLSLGIISRLIANYTGAGTIHTIANKFHLYWGLFKIEQMAIGALGAWCLFKNKEKVLNFLYNPFLVWGSAITCLGFFFVEYSFVGDTLLEAFVFLVIIINVSTNPACMLKFASPKFNTLGNISYGIYMYHTLVIAVLLSSLQRIGLDQNAVLFNSILYVGSVFGTFGLAYLSYNYFESWFLNLKEKFMVVKSSSKAEVIVKEVVKDSQGELKSTFEKPVSV
ncbi:MAG: acyltransferase [Bacteroidetes bacterium]|nr:acyltransferase [Bacteroidota bacterium]